MHSILSMRLGIIVGREADTAKRTYLQTVPKRLMKDNDDPPADVAVAWYIKEHYPGVTVDIIVPEDISLKRLDQNDFVYVMYDLIDAYNEGGIDLYKERIGVYSKTKAILYPTVEMQKLIISKSAYYKLLKDNDIPVAPFISVTKAVYTSKTKAERKRLVSTILDDIKAKEWPGIIAKPELGSYGVGIKVFKDVKDVTKAKLFTFLERAFTKQNFEAMLFQRYMEDFPHYFEIRTYWINGEYKKSVGTIINYSTLGTGDEQLYIDIPIDEGGDIPKAIINDLKVIGKKIIGIMPEMYSKPDLLLRLDFGCCQVLDDKVKGVQPSMCKKYFLNEIELTPNLFPDYGRYDIIKGLGDALVAKAVSITGKKVATTHKKVKDTKITGKRAQKIKRGVKKH
jgi:hypothetical protein